MKRSSLRRNTLRRVAMSPRRTPLKRGNSRLGLRRPGGMSAERRARDLVRSRSGGLCEACGEWPAIEWHHRVRRSQGGSWTASNGLHVCSLCHRWITANPGGARLKGWSLRSHENPAAEAFSFRGTWAWLVNDGSIEFRPPVFPIGGA